jgi:hypothetical protein
MLLTQWRLAQPGSSMHTTLVMQQLRLPMTVASSSLHLRAAYLMMRWIKGACRMLLLQDAGLLA